MTVNSGIFLMLETSLTNHGTHAMHDKGPREVMRMNIVEMTMRMIGVQDAIDTMAALKSHPHGEPLFDELYTEFVENEGWPELAAAMVKPEDVAARSQAAPVIDENTTTLKEFLSQQAPKEATINKRTILNVSSDRLDLVRSYLAKYWEHGSDFGSPLASAVDELLKSAEAQGGQP